MGFNNGGIDAAALRLMKKKSKVIVGGNIGKNKITPNENAFDDYAQCVEVLHPHVDYFVVNVYVKHLRLLKMPREGCGRGIRGISRGNSHALLLAAC
jgi:dihydroorotate dehydrogenase